MEKLEAAMVVVSKAPVAGKVKTRLCPPLTHEQAATLYTGFLLDTLAIAAEVVPIEAVRMVCPSQADAEALRDLASGAEFIVQSGEGLSMALTEAFQSCLTQGFSKVFCISSDNPTLPAAYLKQAIVALDTHEVVLGPSEDGGYYLIGAKAVYPTLFEGMIWSTSSVLAETLARVEARQLSYDLLPEWYDLDTGQDLARFLASLANEDPAKALYTRRALEEYKA